MVASTWSGEHIAGRCVNFVSLLLPQPYDNLLSVDKASVSVLPCSPAGRAIGVDLRIGAEEVFIALLNDLTASRLQEDVRPRYTAQQGWYEVGPVGSDSAVVVMRGKGAGFGKYRAGLLNGTRLEYKREQVFQMLPNTMFEEDRTSRVGSDRSIPLAGRDIKKGCELFFSQPWLEKINDQATAPASLRMTITTFPWISTVFGSSMMIGFMVGLAGCRRTPPIF